jgi:hypothetical protein
MLTKRSNQEKLKDILVLLIVSLEYQKKKELELSGEETSPTYLDISLLKP